MRFVLLILCVLLLASSCAALRDDGVHPRADSTPIHLGAETAPPLRYLILGDSTTVGIGTDAEHRISTLTTQRLARNYRVTMVNAGVSGAKVHDVLVEQLPRVDVTQFDLILIAAGANDVVHLTSSRSVRRDLDELIRTIRSKNCHAKIVLTGTADIAASPRVPSYLRWLSRARQYSLNKVFRRNVKENGLTFAPVAERTGPFFRKDPTLFSEDAFHPNARGYAIWTAVIDEGIDAALASQLEHCP